MPNFVIKAIEEPEYVQKWKDSILKETVSAIMEGTSIDQMDDLFTVLGMFDADIANILYAKKTGCKYVVASGNLSDDFKCYRTATKFKFATHNLDIGRNKVHPQGCDIKFGTIFASWDLKTRASMGIAKRLQSGPLVEEMGCVYIVPETADETTILEKLGLAQ